MTLRLPIPPSVNSAYANIPGVGRIASKRLKNWKREAGWQILIQKPTRVHGPYNLTITVPKRMKGDLDNRLKGIIDLLCELRITPDDSQMHGVTIRRGDVTEMEIEIEAASARKTA